jgi:rod shape-determining protein MreD
MIILAYLLVLLQTTVQGILAITSLSIGTIGPDFLALAAVFFALHVREGVDAMLAGWILGFGMDLASAGGAYPTTVVGPMAIAFSLGAGILYRVREVFFREHPLAQAVLAMLFCLFTHGIWITMQSLVSLDSGMWAAYGRLWMQTLGVSAYSAVLMWLVSMALGKCQRWILIAPVGRSGRQR